MPITEHVTAIGGTDLSCAHGVAESETSLRARLLHESCLINGEQTKPCIESQNPPNHYCHNNSIQNHNKAGTTISTISASMLA